MKTTNTSTNNAVLAKFAQRENMPMVKTILEVTERRLYWSMKALESAQAAELEAQDADSAAQRKAERLAVQREAREDAERYALALIRFSWGREESVLRRAYDNGGALYANAERAMNATAEQRKAAANCGANETIRRLKSEAPQDARRLILSAYDENAADVFFSDRVSDAMDVLQEAALAILETRAARAENADAARAENVGVLDFKYVSDGDKRAACDVTRASRKAERYVNGRRGLALEDFRTLYYESWSEEQDAQEATLLYKRGGVYASLANDTTMGAYDVKMIDSILASLDLKKTQLSRLTRYIGGMTQADIARADNVTESAVSQTFDSIRKKVFKRIEDAAQRADSAAQGKGKRAQEAAQRAANYRKFADMLEDIQARYDSAAELDAARLEAAQAQAQAQAAERRANKVKAAAERRAERRADSPAAERRAAQAQAAAERRTAQAAQAQAQAQAAAERLADLEAPILARAMEDAAADIARANYARRRLARKNRERREREAARRRRLELANCAYWTRDRQERAEREAAALADKQEAARRAFARGTFAASNCAALALPARNAELEAARKAERLALSEAVDILASDKATSRAKMRAAARLERAERERAELEEIERAEREAAAERLAAQAAEREEREKQDSAAQAAQAAQAQAAARCDFKAAQEAAAQFDARQAAQAQAQAAQLARAARLDAAAAQAAAELEAARAELAKRAASVYASAAERRAAIAQAQEAARLAREAMERAQEAARLAREFAEK